MITLLSHIDGITYIKKPILSFCLAWAFRAIKLVYTYLSKVTTHTTITLTCPFIRFA